MPSSPVAASPGSSSPPPSPTRTSGEDGASRTASGSTSCTRATRSCPSSPTSPACADGPRRARSALGVVGPPRRAARGGHGDVGPPLRRLGAADHHRARDHRPATGAPARLGDDLRDLQGRLATASDLVVVTDGEPVRRRLWAAGDAARVLHPTTGDPVPANALWAIKGGRPRRRQHRPRDDRPPDASVHLPRARPGRLVRPGALGRPSSTASRSRASRPGCCAWRSSCGSCPRAARLRPPSSTSAVRCAGHATPAFPPHEAKPEVRRG